MSSLRHCPPNETEHVNSAVIPPAKRNTSENRSVAAIVQRRKPMANAATELLPMPSEFLAAVASKSKVTACPHNLYKYPARFSPEFAREAIRAFSRPGDLILDVFQGGGTTLVESIALGRFALGYDISQLACFLARVKTTPLSIHDERALLQWTDELEDAPNADAQAVWADLDTPDGYYRKNLPCEAQRFFASVISQLPKLKKKRQQQFARLILLSVGQWALDCKTRVPLRSTMQDEYRRQLAKSIRDFRARMKDIAKSLRIHPGQLAARRTIVRASAEYCGDKGRAPRRKASLIVTSPPYPGVHMLYHRWQILGRRETPAPFVLADCRDGDGISFYSLGNRHEKGLVTYFDRLTKVFAAARRSLRKNGLVVQLVAFNQPDWQLPAFLRAMEAAGFTQVMPDLPSQTGNDANLWRDVPGRRWYVEATEKRSAASMEVVLFHRPSNNL